MDKDIQFQIECITVELAEMLMQEYNWDMQKCLDQIYGSRLYEKINEPNCKLYYQGTVYLFDYLQREIETGKLQ